MNMSIKTIKDNSVLAKLFAEEDIHISYKQVPTAAFDVKRRELILPIMKDMTKDIQDLMTLHEVGHAFWTSLDMLNKAKERNLDHSFVNVLEDVRIEKKIQDKYKGAKKVFNNGYKELIANNFFQTNGKDISKYNLIDRINLFYKHHSDVQFSDEEMVWVKKANETKTEKDVLDLAEELHAYIVDQQEQQSDDSDQSSQMMSGDNEDSGEQEGKMIYSGMSFSDEENDDTQESSDSSDDANSSETSNEQSSDSSEESDGDSDEKAPSGSGDEESDNETQDTTSDGSTLDGGGGHKTTKIVAATDQATYKSVDQMRDKNSKELNIVNIPKVNLNEIIINYKDTMKMFAERYDRGKITDQYNLLYFDKTLEELETTFKENKKTISYMVKEFEMKKAADQYARASVSKTGSLDMGRLHTYKYNDDLFRKVTSLPGATSHGFVMFLDWSGSMQYNLPNTIKQLFNIVWFCNRVKIPFEVYAFTDQMTRSNYSEVNGSQKRKVNDLSLDDSVRLLNVLSRNMNKKEQNTMMHNLIMIANTWSGYREWQVEGQQITPPRNLYLGVTPLNHAIVCAMDMLPKFKLDSGVQKVHTIFLTDGDSHCIGTKFDYDENGQIFRSHLNTYRDEIVYRDPITNTKVWDKEEKNSRRRWAAERTIQTTLLLKLLKNRVDGMNIVGFFLAGSNRRGSIDRRTLETKFGINKWSNSKEWKALQETIKKDNVAVCKSEGYDEFYVLPGKPTQESSELDVEQGASKAVLKRAFTKLNNGKLKNRPLLNKFISMVA